MYKIFIKTLLLAVFPMMAILTMEEQSDVIDLLKILKIKNPNDLFYEALPYIKKYSEEEIKNLETDPELKAHALKLKLDINKKLFDPTINKAQQLRILLNFGANFNAQDENGNTVLSRASNKGNYKFVKLLLERGANPNTPNKSGMTTLMETIRNMGNYKEKDSKLIKIANLLIQSNANVNAVKQGDSALSFASKALSEPMVELLLEHGANPNIESTTYHLTPLMYAASKKTTDKNKQSQINIINMLIEHGAQLFKRNLEGKTAIDLAQDVDNTEVADLLREAAQKRAEQMLKPQNLEK